MANKGKFLPSNAEGMSSQVSGDGTAGAEDHREFHVRVSGEERRIKGSGNGPIASLVDSMARKFG